MITSLILILINCDHIYGCWPRYLITIFLLYYIYIILRLSSTMRLRFDLEGCLFCGMVLYYRVVFEWDGMVELDTTWLNCI